MSYGGQQATAPEGGYGGQATASAPAASSYGGQQAAAAPAAAAGGATIIIHHHADSSSSSSSSSDSESEAGQARRLQAQQRAKLRRGRRQQAAGAARVQRDAAARQQAAKQKQQRHAARVARRQKRGTEHKHASPFGQGAEFTAVASSGKTLRIMPNNTVNGTGGEGKLAQFKVSKVQGHKVQFTNAAGNTLRVFKGIPAGGGGGGGLCWFTPKRVGSQWSFATAQGGFLGIKEDGSAKPHAQTGQGAHGRYTVKFRTVWPLGTSFMAQASSGKNLRIMPNGEVNGTGGAGALAQFKVSKVEGKKIQFTNAKGKIMRVHEGKPDGSGGGGGLCWFTPELVKPNVWAFGTAKGGYLGIKEDGSAKPHGQTGKGAHGQFTITMQ